MPQEIPSPENKGGIEVPAGYVKKVITPTAPAVPPNVFEAPPSPDEIAERRIQAFAQQAEELHKYTQEPPTPAEERLRGASRPLRDVHAGTALKSAVDTPKAKISAYASSKGGKRMLDIRPPGAPSILEECETPIKLIIKQHQSPGDILMLTAAIRDLHRAYPGIFQTHFETPCMQLWDNNPNWTKLKSTDPDTMTITCKYPLINECNQGQHHFMHGFRRYLEDVLGIPIQPGTHKPHLVLSSDEKRWMSQVKEVTEKAGPFWIIDAGHKSDFTCKMWEHARYQQVVEAFPDLTFVQVGRSDKSHTHKPLTGDNVVNFIGKTDIRQLCRLMYHAAGVITPVSFPMHLSAAIEMHPMYKRKYRPCIVIAGGREPAVWEQYSTHQFLHTCGQLPCCNEGGCWKSRVEPLLDGNKKDTDRMCERPIRSTSGQIVPQCMDMITAEDVCKQIRAYLKYYDYSGVPSSYKTVPHTIDKDIQDKRDEAKRKQKSADAVRPKGRPTAPRNARGVQSTRVPKRRRNVVARDVAKGGRKG